MKIAIVCPIGHLDRHGYQYVYDICAQSMSDFADLVIFVQSTDNPTGTDMLTQFENVCLISDESTWFEKDGTGAEFFDLNKIEKNVNLGLACARNSGFDVALLVESNQYIPEVARAPLHQACRNALVLRQSFDWLARRDYLAGVTFHASLIRPWIYNMTYKARSKMPDGTLDNGQFIRHLRGDFSNWDACAVVDVPLEMTVQDLDDKLTYFRMYREWVDNRPDKFSWDYWKGYSLNKFKQKKQDGKPLDKYGQAIAERTRGDFASNEILEALNEAA